MSDIHRREFVKQAAAIGSVIGVPYTQSAHGDSSGNGKAPNVLLIMTDTQRLDDMGAYGNPVIKTPSLDSLANTGVRFDNCHTQYPACMPARATVFTGRYPMAHGVWSNGVPLPEDETTLAHVFAQHGYRTGGAGKFHFLPHYPYRKNPLPTMDTHPEPLYGFQEFHLGEDGRSGEHWQWIEKNYPAYVNKPDHEIPIELHNTYWTVSHTIDFVKQCAADKEPFFAFCSFVDPHQGYNPPSPYREMYKPEDMPPPIRRENELEGSRFQPLTEGVMGRYNEKLSHNRAQHYAEMTFIDDNVGRLIETLDELGIRENTLIVFVSDHGDMLGDHWLWWKGPFHYAGCTNVPLFFNWPGEIESGKLVAGITQQTDVLPTILDLVGLDCPDGVQGKSLKPLLTSKEKDTGYEFAYIESVSSGEYHPEYFDHQGKGRKRKPENPIDTLTIRSDEWRFTYYAAQGKGELYDLKKDPNEFENLWDDASYNDVKNELMVRLLDHVAKTRDPLPMKIRPY